LKTHDSVEVDVPGNERAMSGNAMFTIVASTKATAALRGCDREHSPR
jgi:hypothetical protein